MRRRPLSPTVRTLARTAFYLHLWVGVAVGLGILVLAVTGIALNHKRALGLMPDAEHPSPPALEAALPLADLVEAAYRADEAPRGVAIDRMDVRPDDGLVKVRFDDAEVTELTLALDDGRVLAAGRRQDVFLEKLHSGEIFGDGWTLLSDGAAVALLLLTLSGFWLWLFPKFRL